MEYVLPIFVRKSEQRILASSLMFIFLLSRILKFKDFGPEFAFQKCCHKLNVVAPYIVNNGPDFQPHVWPNLVCNIMGLWWRFSTGLQIFNIAQMCYRSKTTITSGQWKEVSKDMQK